MSKFNVGDKVRLDGEDEILTIQKVFNQGDESVYKVVDGDGEYLIVEEDELTEHVEPSRFGDYAITVNINTGKQLIECFLVNGEGKVVAFAHGHILDRGKNYDDRMSIEQRLAQAFSFAAHRLQRQLGT
jgi:intein/homing endonuclease